jgi:glyoxylase-like metal-dependent hydrolase (beta-lactamase superfamily II)
MKEKIEVKLKKNEDSFLFIFSDMKPIDDYSSLSTHPSLFFWQGYDPRVKYLVSCSAIVTSAGLLFIDPLPLAEERLASLLQEAGATPTAIVLTSGNHQRYSVLLAKKYSLPIYAPVDAGEEIVADVWYEPGSDLLGLSSLGLDSIPLPGFGPGETALWHHDEEKKILILGDAITSGEGELLLLPKKYCEDEKLAKKSIRRLISYLPTILLTAHGMPVVTNAAKKMELLLGEEVRRGIDIS